MFLPKNDILRLGSVCRLAKGSRALGCQGTSLLRREGGQLPMGL